MICKYLLCILGTTILTFDSVSLSDLICLRLFSFLLGGLKCTILIITVGILSVFLHSGFSDSLHWCSWESTSVCSIYPLLYLRSVTIHANTGTLTVWVVSDWWSLNEDNLNKISNHLTCSNTYFLWAVKRRTCCFRLLLFFYILICIIETIKFIKSNKVHSKSTQQTHCLNAHFKRKITIKITKLASISMYDSVYSKNVLLLLL